MRYGYILSAFYSLPAAMTASRFVLICSDDNPAGSVLNLDHITSLQAATVPIEVETESVSQGSVAVEATPAERYVIYIRVMGGKYEHIICHDKYSMDFLYQALIEQINPVVIGGKREDSVEAAEHWAALME
jgi:hypothetical protein